MQTANEWIRTNPPIPRDCLHRGVLVTYLDENGQRWRAEADAVLSDSILTVYGLEIPFSSIVLVQS
jgi:hypothetical protein